VLKAICPRIRWFKQLRRAPGLEKRAEATDRGQGTNAINRFLRNLFGQN
jgi:hypothetical protein